jgi:hypothetical protein
MQIYQHKNAAIILLSAFMMHLIIIPSPILKSIQSLFGRIYRKVINKNIEDSRILPCTYSSFTNFFEG